MLAFYSLRINKKSTICKIQGTRNKVRGRFHCIIPSYFLLRNSYFRSSFPLSLNPMSKEIKQGVRPKKRLGQHFLHDQHTAAKIVESLVTTPPATLRLLEIGPGMGVLTRL